VPFNLKSRLLAPIEREYVPGARIHDWLTTSHIDRSYIDRVTLTIFDSPGCKSTSVNPRSKDGGSPACTGKCRYSCGIYLFIRLRQDRSKEKPRGGIVIRAPPFRGRGPCSVP
jgi:hypothetical protein